MKMFMALLVATAMTSSAMAEIKVESATGNWKNLPQLQQRGYNHLNEKVQSKLFEIADSKKCPAFVLKMNRLDFRMGFAAKYDSTGAVTNVLLPKLDCAEAEGVAGGAVLEMLKAGEYEPTGKSTTGWYQGTLGFSYAGKDAAEPGVEKVAAQPGKVKGANPTEMVCQRVEEIGTRLGGKRVCMTRAQWAERRKLDREAVDQAQMQRGCKYESGC